MGARRGPAAISRRELLRAAAATGVAVPMLRGGRLAAEPESGSITFFSTQFDNAEEAERFRGVLTDVYDGAVEFVTGDAGELRSLVEADSVEVNLVGALHGELVSLAADGLLEDLTDVMDDLDDRGYSDVALELSRAGGEGAAYVPWTQTTYVVAFHNDALELMPDGVDPTDLTFQSFLAWAEVAAERAGGPVFGLPGGPNGLIHRFLQGYLYPSFTGAQLTRFTSPEAVPMWQYLQRLWEYCVPASADYEFMQEPMAAGDVLVAWDHVSRLIDAPRQQPADWLFMPAPSGPEGRGYTAVLAGLAIPLGAPAQDASRALIATLSEPDVQLQVLSQNAVFPTVDVDLGDDLPPEIQIAAGGVESTLLSPNGIPGVPPVGLGENEAGLNQAFRDAFTAIVLENADIESTLSEQAEVIQGLLDEAGAPCWPPDPESDGACQVG